MVASTRSSSDSIPRRLHAARLCHVWTALADQGLFLALRGVVDAVTSSAFLRGEWSPLALMLSADPLPLSGWRKSRKAISYISKEMTLQAWYKRSLNLKAGGSILGTRGGVTMTLCKAHFASGHDLKSLAQKLGIELQMGDVEQ